MHFVSLSEYKKLPRRAAQVKMKESEAASFCCFKRNLISVLSVLLCGVSERAIVCQGGG